MPTPVVPSAAPTTHPAASAPASQPTSAPSTPLAVDDVGQHPLVFNTPPGYAGGGGMWTQMLASIMVVMVLGGLALVVVKRLLPRLSLKSPGIAGSGKQVRVLETTYIGPRKALHLVQVGDKKLLLAGSGEAITMLTDVTAACGASFADDLKAQQAKEEGEKREEGRGEREERPPGAERKEQSA